MKPWEWFTTELKRLFRGKELILATLLTPVLGILVFTLVVAPILTQNKGNTKIFFGFVNMDQSESIKNIIQLVFNSKTIHDVAVAYPFSDPETGLQMLRDGKISVLAYVPEDFYEKLQNNEESELYLTSYTSHSFDQNMFKIIIDGSLIDVVQTREMMTTIEDSLIEAGAPAEDSGAFVYDLLMGCMEEYMNRHAILGKAEELSPLEESFPLQHYTASIFSMFSAFAMLPLIYLTASDLNGPVFKRGFIVGRRFSFRFAFTRLLSGATLILLSMFIFVPTAIILQNSPVFLGNTGSDPFVWPALALAMVLSAFAFSSISLLIGSLIPNNNLAVWFGFFLILLMAFMSGILIPISSMPHFMAEISRFVPLKSVMNIMSNLLFKIEIGRYFRDSLRLLIIALLSCFTGVAIVLKKGA